MVVPDPQDVPADVIERRGVLDPEAVLASRVWPCCATCATRATRRAGMRDLRRAARSDLGRVSPARCDGSCPLSVAIAGHGGGGRRAPPPRGGRRRVTDHDPARGRRS